jgi:hypothetical protein
MFWCGDVCDRLSAELLQWMLWLLKLVINDTERNNIGGGGKVDDNGVEVRNSSKLPAQEYGGGITVLACGNKTRHLYILQHIFITNYNDIILAHTLILL